MSKPLTKTQLCTLEVVRFFKENPDKWCKHALARDKAGESVHPINAAAEQFCFIGAWMRLGLSEVEMPRGFNPHDYNDNMDNVDAMLHHVQRLAGLPVP